LPDCQQANHVNDQNYQFRSEHIGKDCSDEEPILTLEQSLARRAMVFDLERTLDRLMIGRKQGKADARYEAGWQLIDLRSRLTISFFPAGQTNP